MSLSKRNHYTLGTGMQLQETGTVWTKLIKIGTPCKCEKCNSAELIYDGLGHYICTECGTEYTDNYGKVRDCIESNGLYTDMPLNEVLRVTGLTKGDIKDLITLGKIHQGFYGLSIV